MNTVHNTSGSSDSIVAQTRLNLMLETETHDIDHVRACLELWTMTDYDVVELEFDEVI